MDLKQQVIVNVQAYKHDGTLYRQWNGVKVIEISPISIVLLMYKTKVAEFGEQKWVIREPMLWFIPLDNRFFNTTALIRKSGIYYYTNIASPPIFEEGAIKYIDYDIDIKFYPNQKLKLVDVLEYEFHKKKFKYQKSLVEKIDKTTKDVFKMIKYRDEYFDFDVVDSYLRDLVDSKDLAKKFLIMNSN